MKFKQAIITIALSGILVPTAHAVNMTNTSKTRGFWMTIYDRGDQSFSGCIAPGKSIFRPNTAGKVRVEVTTNADCTGVVTCDTDMEIHTSAPLSVYPQSTGGCYIDRMADNGNSPTYRNIPIEPETGESTTVNNVSSSRGYWVTTYLVTYGTIKTQKDHGCVMPGQQVTFGRADIVKIEVTSDPYCKQQTLCGTDTYSHSAPISVYRNQNGCYIDYTINHQGDGGYQKAIE